MTDLERNEIKGKWDAGVSVQQIVRTMPYKRSTALRYLWEMQREGFLAKRERKRGRDFVVEAYNNGMHNPYEIAELFGYTHKTVTTYLTYAKLNRPRRENGKLWVKRDCLDRTKEIIKCLESGVGVSETARRFGVTRQWVSVIKKRSEKENG